MLRYLPTKWLLCCLLLAAAMGTQGASVNLVKTVNKTNPLSGETFTYTLQYRCASTTEACNGVMITDPIPASLEYVSLTGSIHTTNEVYNSSTKTVTFTFVNPLPAGTTGQVTISVRFPNKITPNGTAATNTATMSASNAPTVTSSVTVTAQATNRFTVKKYYSGGSPGNQMIYGFEVANGSGNGTLLINNITITDVLPTNAVFHSATDGGTYNATTKTVTWTISSLDLGVTVWPQMVITYPSANYSVGASVTNTGTVKYTPFGMSQITIYPSVTHTLVSPRATVGIKKSGSSSFQIGTAFDSHNFTFYNSSTAPLSNFYLEDLFPAGLRPLSFQTGNFYLGVPNPNMKKYIKYKTNLNATWQGISANPMDPWTNNTINTSSLGLASGEYIIGLRWEFGTDPLPVGSGLSGSIKITYDAVPTNAPIGTGTNCITANASNLTMNYSEPNCHNFTINPAINYYISSPEKAYLRPGTTNSWRTSATTGEWFNTGDVITFRLRARNASTAGANLSSPIIADLLPVGFEYIDGSWTHDAGTSGAAAPTFVKTNNYKNTGRTHLRWEWSGASFAPSKEAFVTFRARILSTAGSGENVARNAAAMLNPVINNDCSSSGINSKTSDALDLDNDGNTSETFCHIYSDIDILQMPALSSIKYVKGQLDPDWTRYPQYGNAVPGGVADYRLIVRNDGNIPIKNLKIVDILPFVGDRGVIDLSLRDTRWRPNLAGAVAAPAGVTVYYSTVGNPCRSAEGIEPNGPAGCQTPNWTTSLPTDVTTVQSLKFDFGTNILQPSDSIVLEWPMRAPVNALSTIGALPDTIAWASFGYIGTRNDNNVPLLAAEPLKVGIRMQGYTPAVLGDQVWSDTDKDGIQDFNETGINAVRVELYQDNGDGIANPLTDNLFKFTVTGNGGFYLFPNLDPGNYFLVYYLPPNYDLSPAKQGGNNAFDSDATFTTVNGRRAAITPVINLPNVVDLNWDLGIYPNGKASVGDYVWIDQNNNGLQDESSSFGVNNITVNLYQNSAPNTVFATTLTKNDLNGNPGYYLFENLQPNTYIVEVIKPASTNFTTKKVTGVNASNDSDLNTSTGRTDAFTLAVNEYNSTIDGGIKVNGTTEICNNGVDDDNDNLTDCNDPNCGAVILSNVTVGSCINHAYADVATLSVKVSWAAGAPNEQIAVTIDGKTVYIPAGSSSPMTVSFLVPADGSQNNSITANFIGYTCGTTITYNAPAPCSNDALNCSVLYLHSDYKGADADAFDRGLIEYLDGINGSKNVVSAFTKNAANLALFNSNSTNSPITLNIDTFSIIIVSASTEGKLSPDLITALKNTPANVILLSQNSLLDLALASGKGAATQQTAANNATTQFSLYNFDNPTPTNAPLVGWGNYNNTATAFLWKTTTDVTNGIAGVFFHYVKGNISTLPGLPASHGSRTFLGYSIDGVYTNSSNGGVTPVPTAKWFDPIRNLTLEGKYYLDEAIKKAAAGCNVENCSNGIDDDGDGLIDCGDPDCAPFAPSTIIKN
jgi:uncharacterized repeat protein (TIGR01451 family)